jgi:2-dehydro-3-deoxyphosphogluconate aldolase/(4S)-4-hydroxy-2-oxoglutarate aldolase
MDASKLLAGAKIVPVVVIDDVDTAVPLAECILAAGLEVIEVTLRTEAGVEAIRRIADAVPGMIVGAGSIRTVDHVEVVVEAGAKFGVAPGATGRLLNAVNRAGLPFIPGAISPSEVMRLLQRGYTLQKFFPAEISGGIKFLEAVGGPLPEARFIPTGGISAQLAQDYLALGNVAAVGGSWITPKAMLEAGDFDAIGRIAADAAQLGL